MEDSRAKENLRIRVIKSNVKLVMVYRLNHIQETNEEFGLNASVDSNDELKLSCRQLRLNYLYDSIKLHFDQPLFSVLIFLSSLLFYYQIL